MDDTRDLKDEMSEEKSYEKPILTEINLEGEDAVLGACRIIAIGCDSYQY